MMDTEHKTLPPDRDLAAELDTIAAEHAEFAMTLVPAMQELRMVLEQQRTEIDMLKAQLFNVQAHMPVGILN